MITEKVFDFTDFVEILESDSEAWVLLWKG